MADYLELAEEMIRGRGERITSSRVQILAMLLAEQRAIAHHEIEKGLRNSHKLDRVTLYRVLDWLTEKRFVHRMVSDDRIWRFRVNRPENSQQHAHFECTRCTKIVCLEELNAEYDQTLPPGYRFHGVELTVKGLCAECA